MNVCHRCSENILHLEELSIDHVKSWMKSDTPVDTFFDLDNIAFSHLSCNSAAGRTKPDHLCVTDSETRRYEREKQRKRRARLKQKRT